MTPERLAPAAILAAVLAVGLFVVAFVARPPDLFDRCVEAFGMDMEKVRVCIRSAR
jgi:hypothetical protein